MEIGASSACFYPKETEKAFLRIAKLGFTQSEIFFNSPCELEKSFIKELDTIRKSYNISVASLHPCTSFAEGYMFFSSYERRFFDAVENYKKYFEAAATLGAKYIVFHGAKGFTGLSTEQYAERFLRLNETAKAFGCTVAHENVVNFVGQAPEFMYNMKHLLGTDFKMVLDIKQARRAQADPFDFIKAMKESIVHLHLSDFNSSFDCIPPNINGSFDFEKLFEELDKTGYKGKYIIELYSNSFKNENEILTSAKYLEGILNKVKQR